MFGKEKICHSVYLGFFSKPKRNCHCGNPNCRKKNRRGGLPGEVAGDVIGGMAGALTEIGIDVAIDLVTGLL